MFCNTPQLQPVGPSFRIMPEAHKRFKYLRRVLTLHLALVAAETSSECVAHAKNLCGLGISGIAFASYVITRCTERAQGSTLQDAPIVRVVLIRWTLTMDALTMDAHLLHVEWAAPVCSVAGSHAPYSTHPPVISALNAVQYVTMAPDSSLSCLLRAMTPNDPYRLLFLIQCVRG